MGLQGLDSIVADNTPGMVRIDSAEIFNRNPINNLKTRLQRRSDGFHNEAKEPTTLVAEVTNTRQVAIDFAGVTSLSSENLGGLIQANREARKMDYSVVLVNVGDSIRDILLLTRLDRLFQLVGTEALADDRARVDDTVLA
jgi:anti-anti-sigma factor